jgi:hypothetical protein
MLCNNYINASIWISMSSSVILYNKYILHYANFRNFFLIPAFPLLLTTWHMLFSALATRVMAKTTNLLDGLDRVDINWSVYFKAIMPIGLLFSASLAFCNYAYLTLSVSFIQMIKVIFKHDI